MRARSRSRACTSARWFATKSQRPGSRQYCITTEETDTNGGTRFCSCTKNYRVTPFVAVTSVVVQYCSRERPGSRQCCITTEETDTNRGTRFCSCTKNYRVTPFVAVTSVVVQYCSR